MAISIYEYVFRGPITIPELAIMVGLFEEKSYWIKEAVHATYSLLKSPENWDEKGRLYDIELGIIKLYAFDSNPLLLLKS